MTMSYNIPTPAVDTAPKKPETPPPPKKQQSQAPSSQPAMAPAVVVPGKYLHSAPQRSFSSSHGNTASRLSSLSALLGTDEEQKPKIIPEQKPEISAEQKARLEEHEAKVRYDAVLIGLADEYFAAAYRLGPRVARLGGIIEGSNENNMVDSYQKLIVAGLGCLEAALKNFKYVPAVEAALIQKYAVVMFEETENYDDMEAILTKGVSSSRTVSIANESDCVV
jgi:Cohesin loading factor